MATPQELSVAEKKELVSKEERTVSGRHYVPCTDIYQTDAALTMVMEMPGVERKSQTVVAGGWNATVAAERSSRMPSMNIFPAFDPDAPKAAQAGGESIER